MFHWINPLFKSVATLGCRTVESVPLPESTKNLPQLVDNKRTEILNKWIALCTDSGMVTYVLDVSILGIYELVLIEVFTTENKRIFIEITITDFLKITPTDPQCYHGF